MSLDGKNITDVISVPKNEGEDNYDDYNKVKENVNLTAGEHILRFTVTGSWMDVDYFTFVKGKNATDPEPIGGDNGGDNPPDFIKPALSHAIGAENYRIFDMNGNYLGMVRASGMQELRASAKTLVKNSGTFIAKSCAGSTTIRIK
jgi:hypothetical protein